MSPAKACAAVAVAVLVIIVHVAGLLRALKQEGWTWRRLSCFSWWKGMCSSAGGEANDEANEEASIWNKRWNELLLETRVEYFFGLQRVIMHVVAFLAWRVVIQLAVGQGLEVSMRHVGGYAGIAFTYVLTNCCPQLLTGVGLAVMHTWYMAIHFCYGLEDALQDIHGFRTMGQTLFAMRLVFATVYPEALPNLFWTLLWAATSCAVQLSANSAVRPVVQAELVRAVVITFLIRQVELLQHVQVRSEIEAAGHMREKGKMERILEAMCDAVVELGPDLRIKAAAPRLASLLLRHTNPTRLRGEVFTDMIHCQNDSDRFSDLVAPAEMPGQQDDVGAAPSGAASNMYLNLRDSNGTPVPVQLFHSSYKDVKEEVCHVVGVREVEQSIHADAANIMSELRTNIMAEQRTNIMAEQRTNTMAEQRVDGDAATTSQVHAAVAPDLRDTVSDLESEVGSVADSVVSMSSVGTTETLDTGAAFVPILPELEAKATASVVFDGRSGNIIGCTTGFTSVTGPIIVGAAHMRNVIKNFEAFENWYRVQANRVLFGDEPESFELQVAQPIVPNDARYEISATGHIVCATDNEDGEFEGDLYEGFDLICVLALENVRGCVRGHRRRRRRRKAPTRSTRYGLITI